MAVQRDSPLFPRSPEAPGAAQTPPKKLLTDRFGGVGWDGKGSTYSAPAWKQDSLPRSGQIQIGLERGPYTRYSNKNHLLILLPSLCRSSKKSSLLFCSSFRKWPMNVAASGHQGQRYDFLGSAKRRKKGGRIVEYERSEKLFLGVGRGLREGKTKITSWVNSLKGKKNEGGEAGGRKEAFRYGIRHKQKTLLTFRLSANQMVVALLMVAHACRRIPYFFLPPAPRAAGAEK